MMYDVIVDDGCERRYRCHRRQCSCLVTFDDDKIRFHCDATHLDEECVIDLTVVRPVLLYIYVDVVVVW